jgi:hypothetical protein
VNWQSMERMPDAVLLMRSIIAFDCAASARLRPCAPTDSNGRQKHKIHINRFNICTLFINIRCKGTKNNPFTSRINEKSFHSRCQLSTIEGNSNIAEILLIGYLIGEDSIGIDFSITCEASTSIDYFITHSP